MAKRISERAKELKAQIKELKAEEKKELEKSREVWLEWCDMEGMYGKKVYCGVWGMHDRGYIYEYETPELEAKEEKERQDFLDKYWIPEREIERKYDELLELLEDELCKEVHGMSKAEKDLRSAIKRQEKEIAWLEAHLEFEKEELAEMKEKLAKFQKKGLTKPCRCANI